MKDIIKQIEDRQMYYEGEIKTLNDRVNIFYAMMNRRDDLLREIWNLRILLSDETSPSNESEFMTSGEYGVCDADCNALSMESVATVLNVVAKIRTAMEKGIDVPNKEANDANA